MSAPTPSDPRLLLPEWLRDGEMPAPVKTQIAPAPPPEGPEPLIKETIVRVESIDAAPAVTPPNVPFSDRLSLDTRLDPGSLVSAADLPIWLGGLEHVAPAAGPSTKRQTSSAPAATIVAPIDSDEPDDEIDTPSNGVIDVEVSGWVAIAAAAGLLILLAAALKLYLS